MPSDLASRRAQAPLAPIKINVPAPSPGIHTSFDDALLQVKTPNSQASPQLSGRSKSQPAGPAFVISSQSTTQLEPVDASSGAALAGTCEPRLLRVGSANSLSSTQRFAQRERPAAADVSRTAPPAEALGKPRKSRPSLFHLFSRPNVERARAAGQGDRGVAGIPTLTPDTNNEARARLSKNVPRAPSHQLSSDRAAVRQPSFHSLKDKSSRAHLTVDSSVATHTPSISSPTRETQQEPMSSIRSNWTAPPLFQAYPQAVRYSTLSLPDSSSTSSEAAGGKPTQASPPSTAPERPKSRPGTSRFSRPKSRKNDSDSHSSGSQSFEAFQSGSAATKIYVLVTAGYLLQYAGDGSYDRLPEKILQLTSESAAFASDLIPGKHWVLQVVKSSADEPLRSPPPSKSSFFSKLTMPGLRRRDVSGMLMTFDKPEDMDSWMSTVRREIERLSGDDRPRLQTALRTNMVAADEQQAKSPVGHRYATMSRSPSMKLGSVSPLSPFGFDSESTSATTRPSNSSDATGDRSPRGPGSFQKPVSYSSEAALQETDLRASDLGQGASATTDLPPSPGSPNEEDDFEYLFPSTPQSARAMNFPLPPTTTASATLNGAGSAPTNRQAANGLVGTSAGHDASKSGQTERRVSTYNLLPAGAQRPAPRQNLPMLMRNSSFPAPAATTQPANSRSSQRANGASINTMESISEASSFFHTRAPSSQPSAPAIGSDRGSVVTRASSSYHALAARQGGGQLRAAHSAENLPARSHEAEALARRTSARTSLLQGVQPLSDQVQDQQTFARNLQTRNSQTSSHNAFALASLPEGTTPAMHSATSSFQSNARSSQHTSPSTASSASTSRRTSFRNSGMPIPLQTSASATASRSSAGFGSFNSSQRCSALSSATLLSSHQSPRHGAPPHAESSQLAETATGKPFGRQPPSPTNISDTLTSRQANRPLSIQVSSDRAPFLSTNRPSRTPDKSNSAGPSPLDPSSAPGSLEMCTNNSNKRDSTLVPVVRPPSLAKNRLRGSVPRFGSTPLPPQQPPPSIPLPMLPSAPLQRA